MSGSAGGPLPDREIGVAVIGAGIAGVSVASRLAERGADVVLMDRAGLAAGASGVSAGMLHAATGRRAALSTLHLEGLATTRRLVEALAPHAWRARGVLRLTRDPGQWSLWQRDAEQRAAARMLLLAGDAIADHVPGIGGRPHGALWLADGGVVDIPAFLRAQIERAGVPLVEAQVKAVKPAGGGGWHLEGAGLRARKVVLCVGVDIADWAALLCAPDAPAFRRDRGEALVLQVGEQGVPRGYGLRGAEGAREDGAALALAAGHYVVPAGQGVVVVGGSHDERTPDRGVTSTGVRALAERGLALWPGLASARLLGVRSGVRPSTASRAPVWGQVPNHRGLFWLAGLGAKGLLLGPLLAERVARVVLEDR